LAYAPLPPATPSSRSIAGRGPETRKQLRLNAARASYRARNNPLDDNKPSPLPYLNFHKIIALSSIAGAFLLAIAGASLLVLASIPLIRPIPCLGRINSTITFRSPISLSPPIQRLSPWLYGYLAKQNAEQQGFVNRYKAKKKAEQVMDTCVENKVPNKPFNPTTTKTAGE